MVSRIVDIHPHIISEDTQRYPIAPLGGKRSVYSSKRPITLEQLVAQMDLAGVDKAAIVQSSTTYGYDNSYLADCVATNTKRFAGVFSVDVLAPAAPENIRHLVKDRKLSGMRIFTAGSTIEKQSDTLGDPRSFPAWETCTELGIPVCVQMRPEGLPQLLALLQRFRNTRIVLDHLAHAPIDDAPAYSRSAFLLDLAKYRNVYLKLTTANLRDSYKGKGRPEVFFPGLVEQFGASRIAWGSNYPASEGTLVELVKEAKTALACLSPSDQEWIFARTAQSLYPALADS